MKYPFPHIKKFSDIEKYIDLNCFYISEKDGYKVVNYRFTSPETFPDISDDRSKMVREFRGITFDTEGNIICRKYHKFFNAGERAETRIENIDITKPHVILDKLDGSMITPMRVGDRIIFGTKLGETEVSKEPQKFAEARENYMLFVKGMLDIAVTPIFEWCSNKNRIVLDYPEDQLILTGLRKMFTGEYLSYKQMKEYADWFKIPIVKAYSGKLDQALIDRIRQAEGIEGIVVRFDDGHMIKLKADAYVALHQVKSDINNERNLTAIILNEKLDDLKPLLHKDDLQKVEKFEKDLTIQMLDLTGELKTAVNYAKTVSRKEFALTKEIPHYIKHMVFSIYENMEQNLMEVVSKFVIKNCNNNRNYDNMKTKGNLLENLPNWNPLMFSE